MMKAPRYTFSDECISRRYVFRTPGDVVVFVLACIATVAAFAVVVIASIAP